MSNEDLPPPPWFLNVPPPKPFFFPKTTHFTQQEVETIDSHKILTTVFNVCLENKRILDSWKGALINRCDKWGRAESRGNGARPVE